MSDKMTPEMRAEVLREIANVATAISEALVSVDKSAAGKVWRFKCAVMDDARSIEEAARREADAKPNGACDFPNCLCYFPCQVRAKELGRTSSVVAEALTPQGEREGPGSAAANVWETGEYQAFVDAVQKPAPAADDLAEWLRCIAKDDNTHPADSARLLRGADKIEAQAREIAELTRRWHEAMADARVSAGRAESAYADAGDNAALKARVARLTEANAELMHALDTAIACLDAGLGKGAADGTSLPRILAKHRAALAEAPDAQ